MPRPTRESQAIDHIEDVFGRAWLVRDHRPTGHGFDIATGWPDEPGRQGATVIVTPALAEYLTATERLRDVDLPIGQSTIKRLRASLDLRFDSDAWWAERAADLTSLTLEQFCARHRCSMGAASQRRRDRRASC